MMNSILNHVLIVFEIVAIPHFWKWQQLREIEIKLYSVDELHWSCAGEWTGASHWVKKYAKLVGWSIISTNTWTIYYVRCSLNTAIAYIITTFQALSTIDFYLLMSNSFHIFRIVNFRFVSKKTQKNTKNTKKKTKNSTIIAHTPIESISNGIFSVVFFRITFYAQKWNDDTSHRSRYHTNIVWLARCYAICRWFCSLFGVRVKNVGSITFIQSTSLWFAWSKG